MCRELRMLIFGCNLVTFSTVLILQWKKWNLACYFEKNWHPESVIKYCLFLSVGMAAGSDLPHTPSTPADLYYKAIRATKELERIYHTECEYCETNGQDKPSMPLYAAVTKTQWGAKVEIRWKAPELECCHCNQAECQNLHDHSLKRSTYKVSSDATFILFEKCIVNEISFFRSVHKSWRERALEEDWWVVTYFLESSVLGGVSNVTKHAKECGTLLTWEVVAWELTFMVICGQSAQ